MSSKRITKDIAQKVSIRIAADSFKERLEKVRKKIRAYTDKLVEEYIPRPVLDVTNEYDKFFVVTNMIGVKSENRYLCISESNYNLPSGLVIVVKPDQYDKLKTVNKEKRAVIEQRDDFSQTVFNAICDLKTEKRVREQIPEIIPYLALFQEATDVTPKTSNSIDTIRKNILTPEKNEKE